MISPGRDGLHHPASEDEVALLVRWAARRGLPVRVVGAGHSVPDAIHASAGSAGRPGAAVELSLDRFAGVAFDDARREASVDAGCRFGADPRERSGRASAEAGLCWQLDARGWALPNLAGLTHQTLGGFLMTGSAGGSRRRALDAALVGLRLASADGEVRELSRERDPDLFHAAGTSLGVLGVVTGVTLRCEERYDVVGEERTVAVAEAPFDLFADGDGGADGYLREHEYARLLWWPQRGVERLTLWAGRRVPGPPSPTPTPYRPLPALAGSTLPAQAAAGALLALAGRARWTRATAAAYRAFLPARAAPTRFRDAWWRALPMDDAIDERLLPVAFTEAWLPADATGEALRRLRDRFAAGDAAAGTFCVEVYGAGASPFWLSPGSDRDSTRLNFFWLERNPGDPQRWFAQFWDLLGDLGMRLHWGKHLPAGAAARWAAAYPRWDDFLAQRERLDPGGTFLSDYWRDQLGIPPARSGAAPAAAAPSRGGEPVRSRGHEPLRARGRELLPVAGGSGRAAAPPARRRRGPRWPLLFRVRPSDPTLAERAGQVMDTQLLSEHSGEQLYDAFVELAEARHWLEHFVRVDDVERGEGGRERVFDEVFTFMTLRVRTLRESERGRRWMASVDACSMPLATEMYEQIDLEPLPDGRTRFRWRIWYDPVPWVRPAHPLVRRFFLRMFRRSVERLERHLAAGGGDQDRAASLSR